MAIGPLGETSPPFSYTDASGRQWTLPTSVAQNLGLTNAQPVGTALPPPIAVPDFAPPADAQPDPVDPYPQAPDLGPAGDFASQLKNAVVGAVGSGASMVQDVTPPTKEQTPIDPYGAEPPRDVFERKQDAVDQATSAQVAAEQEASTFQQRAEQTLAEQDAARQAERQRERYELQQAEIEQGKALEKAQNHQMGSLWSDSSTGNKALLLLGVALSTIGAARSPHGTKNPAVDALLALTDKHTQLKLAERARLDRMGKEAGDRIAQMRDYARSTEQLYQMTRASYLGDISRQLDMIRDKSKSEVMKANAETVKAGIEQERNAAIAAGHEAARKAMLEEREQQRKEFETIEDIKVKRSQVAASRYNAQLDYAAKMAQIEESKAERLAKVAGTADAAVVEREVPDLVMANGQMYQARDSKVATAVMERFAAAQSVTNLVNDLKRMRLKYGNKAAAMQSPEWQQMVATSAAISNSIRTAEQMGALDKGALDQMNKMMGGADLRDGVTDAMLGALWDPRGNPTAGLDQLRSNVATKFNDYARAARYSRGPEYVDWKPPEVDDVAPIKTKDQEKVQKAIDEKTPDQIRAAGKPGITQRYLNALNDGPTPSERAAEAKVTKVGDVRSGNILTTSQRDTLDIFAKAAASSDPKKQAEGRRNLVAIASGALDKGKDALAQQALDRLAMVGDEKGLAEIEAKLVAGAKSETEIERRRAPIKFARQQAELAKQKPKQAFGWVGKEGNE